uniref:Uncharacterized protein n=1 Tax=Eutreptiella gymnastica TaxID=73025 RepID=A0A7S4G864_9EUGL
MFMLIPNVLGFDLQPPPAQPGSHIPAAGSGSCAPSLDPEATTPALMENHPAPLVPVCVRAHALAERSARKRGSCTCLRLAWATPWRDEIASIGTMVIRLAGITLYAPQHPYR